MDDKMGRAQSHRQGGPRLICLVAQNRPGAFRYPIDVIGGPNGDSKLLRQTVGRQRIVIGQTELFSKLDRSPLTLRFEPSSECHLVSSSLNVLFELSRGLRDEFSQSESGRLWDGFPVLECDLKVSNAREP